jgi:hypothetical protein
VMDLPWEETMDVNEGSRGYSDGCKRSRGYTGSYAEAKLTATKAAEVSRSYRCVYGAAEGLFPTLQAQGGGNEGRQGQRRR